MDKDGLFPEDRSLRNIHASLKLSSLSSFQPVVEQERECEQWHRNGICVASSQDRGLALWKDSLNLSNPVLYAKP